MDNTYEKNESLLQVRYYIYNIIRKNGKQSVKIPSSYELAEMFGLSRRVVQRELERLIASGVLIGRKRIGTFTKPSPLEIPLFGITYGNGDHFMWGYFEMEMLSAVFHQLSRFECNIHDLKITTRIAANCIQTLKSMALNAILWIGTPDWPDGEAEKLYRIAAEEKLPLFTCATKLHSGLSGVDFSYRKGLKELQKICKSLNIDATGMKAELNHNIEQYFKGNLIAPKKAVPAIPRSSTNQNYQTLVLTPQTSLIECGFCFNQRFRDFFSKQTGTENFKFNVDMVATAKKVKETNDISFTLGDLLDIFYGKKTYAKYDKVSLQWNKFVQDFCADPATACFPNKLKTAALLWKEVRTSTREKIYKTELLKEFSDIINKEN